MDKKTYIQVILPLKLEWDPWYYAFCKEAEGLECGDRVRVCFAHKEYIGVISSVGGTPDIPTKMIQPVLSKEEGLERILPQEIELWRRVAQYYMCTTGEVYKAAYPIAKTNLEEARAAARLRVIQRKEKIEESIKTKIERLEARLEKKRTSAKKAKEGTKSKANAIADICRIEDELARAIQALETAARNTEAARQGHPAIASDSHDRVSLSPAQEAAFRQIKAGFAQKKPVLLHGVTGSGKTEIYIKLAHEALSAGKSVLYLVPEIALSRQLEDRLYEHFGERLNVYHSAETAASRRNTAEVIRSSNAYMLLGTRSSIFLPHHDLGLIIIDEEHDSSYKQDSPAPRYNGRDTALMLSVIHGCDTVLGSATPSFEETYNCLTGRHLKVILNERYHGSEGSDIEIIDTKAERRKRGMVGNFSRKLIDRIEETLREGGQAIILRSRRAWAGALQCETCGEIQKCPHCNVSLSLHKAQLDRMVCHYCGYSIPYTARCSKCSGDLVSLGAGTQKIEDEASSLFPQARIARLDSDTAKDRSYESQIIRGFEKGEIDILIGTQIVTKGFDFSRLSLVAVIAADALLGIQDFRADEKAMQLLEQFRGRSGRRGGKGLLVIQTSQPEHPVYRLLSCAVPPDMTTDLLQERKDFGFPPFTRIVEISIRDIYEDRAHRMAGRLAMALKEEFNETISGPYSPTVDKIADTYIRSIRICLRKGRQLTNEKSRLKTIINDFEKKEKYDGHISVNVDPS